MSRLRSFRRAESATTSAATASRPRGDGFDYYDGVTIGAGTVGARAVDPAFVRSIYAELAESADDDDYLRYLREFVSTGYESAGDDWRYADIVTALAAATELLQPRTYLEIGVRRGRSMVTVARRAPEALIVGVDLWDPGYAQMENPGPDHVRAVLAAASFAGTLELLSGSSHDLVPELFRKRPDLDFDLVTVDGDHSASGATRDIRNVLPRLRIGGALVFDDLRHPLHPDLHDVWRREVVRHRRYSTWEFDDVGYGVGIAVRRW